MTTKTIADLDVAGLRKFGITTGIALIVIFGLFLPWVFSFNFPIWPWIVAAVLGIWALVAPATLQPVYRGWMKFALILNKITTPIIMGLVFFLVFMPMGFLMRAIKGDPLNRKIEPELKSYRVESSNPDVDRMEKPF